MFQEIFGVATIGSVIYAATINNVYMYIVATIIILLVLLFLFTRGEKNIGKAFNDVVGMILLLGILSIVCTASWFITIPVLLYKNDKDI